MSSASSAQVRPVTEPFVHPALFYRGVQGYLAGTVPFIREGLKLGEPVAVAVPGRNLPLLRSELGDSAAQVRWVDMAQAGRNPGWIIPGVLRGFADAHPDGRVRIIGQPIWPGRSEDEYPACVQHEALINLAFTGRAVTILCPYDADELHPRVLADAAATHPLLIDDDGEHHSAAYAPEDIRETYDPPLAEPDGRPVLLAFDETNLGQARALAAEHARRAGLAADRVMDVELAVNEMAANSLAHGGGAGSLRVWSQDVYLVFEVQDTGFISDPLVGRHPLTLDMAGGRGVLVVNQLSDLVRMHTRPGGTTVRAHFVL
ncbi:sensor histidine kinase [Actinoallomurus bryophytorum]|uniref:Anti-sigma regulatory factor (Ser/Thr protein kinase) n=1 Tax=Actinoallomurus bryophytorum TaxID=1490222 RepID=A0A543BZD0_9ACTN|nr:sensor histidine kinase [Actinoallomurus bryophytorum]TQL90175.1 anti-sigma regulatory factor (Ser/Thr protein kinase) [Actinoallomurus bryophytorum]